MQREVRRSRLAAELIITCHGSHCGRLQPTKPEPVEKPRGNKPRVKNIHSIYFELYSEFSVLFHVIRFDERDTRLSTLT